MSVVTLDALPHQAEFATASERYVALTGGFGCGKSFGVGLKVLNLARINAGFDGMLVSRSAPQLRKLCTEVETVFNAAKVRWRKKGFDEYHVTFGSATTVIYLGTTENRAYTRWAGGNLAFVVIDELDTMQQADDVWRFSNDRVRVKAPLLQTACASTPEGFGFLWDFFDNQPMKDPSLRATRRLIKGCTFDNPYVDKSYVRSQIQTRDPRSLRAYVYGEFVSLEGALVYHRFDKVLNATNKTVADFSPQHILHIGLDFNKNINAASVWVVQDGVSFCVDELYGATDTDALIGQLDKRFPNRLFYIYPDATGFEGIQQLRRKYGSERVCVKASNPRVQLRVASVNQRLRSETGMPLAYVNPQKAPHLWNGLMRQPKLPNGEPNKDLGLDHATDGAGYFMTWHWPAREPDRPVATVLRG